jgi:hypothetical protein
VIICEHVAYLLGVRSNKPAFAEYGSLAQANPQSCSLPLTNSSRPHNRAKNCARIDVRQQKLIESIWLEPLLSLFAHARYAKSKLNISIDGALEQSLCRLSPVTARARAAIAGKACEILAVLYSTA